MLTPDPIWGIKYYYFSHLQTKKQRHREVKSLARGHIQPSLRTEVIGMQEIADSRRISNSASRNELVLGVHEKEVTFLSAPLKGIPQATDLH